MVWGGHGFSHAALARNNAGLALEEIQISFIMNGFE
jgi:hypothetical protein